MATLPNPNISTTIAGVAGKIAVGAGLANAITGNNDLRKVAGIASLVSVGAGAVARLANAGLKAGGLPQLPGGASGDAVSSGAEMDSRLHTTDDWRVRISIGEKSGIFYKNSKAGILAPLADTNGVVFPYTPQISVNYQNNYQSQSLTHSNQPSRAYQSSEVSSITITGTFTAQTPQEANYVLAVLHFFRSASKMFFGSSDTDNVGAPPPILFLNGFGQHYFPNVSVLLTSFVHTMADDVDFTFAGTDERTRVPTTSSVQLTLVPQYSRKRAASFNLDAFARGDLINGKGNFI